MMWLEEQDGFTPQLAGSSSQRHSDQGKAPLHFAVERGFTFLADRLLAVGGSMVSQQLAGAIQITKNSQLKNVREWRERHDMPTQLTRDVLELYRCLKHRPQMLALAYKHIVQSRCLDLNRWNECNFGWNKPCQLGKTYFDVLLDCCGGEEGSNDFFIDVFVTLARGDDEFRCSAYFCLIRNCGVLGLDWSEWSSKGYLEVPSLTTVLSRTTEASTFVRLLSLMQSWSAPIHVGDPYERDPLFLELSRACTNRGFDRDKAIMARIRERLIRIDFLCEFLAAADSQVQMLFLRGHAPRMVEEGLSAIRDATNQLAMERGLNPKELFDSKRHWETWSGVLGMKVAFMEANYHKSVAFRRQIRFRGDAPASFEVLYVVLAVEDYVELTHWCLSRPSTKTVEIELDMAAIAAYYGHSSTVDLLLKDSDVLYNSLRIQRVQSAFLGAVEGGRLSSVVSLRSQLGPKPFPFPSDPFGNGIPEVDTFDELTVLHKSISIRAANGFLTCSENVVSEYEAVFRWLLSHKAVTSTSILSAAIAIVAKFRRSTDLNRFALLLEFLIQDTPFDYVERFQCLEENTARLLILAERSLTDEWTGVVSKWLKMLVEVDVDIQNLKFQSHYNHATMHLHNSLSELQKSQLCEWKKFDVVKSGQSLLLIQQAVQVDPSLLGRRDRNGMLLSHLAAAYDRRDLLEWLVVELNAELEKNDNLQRNVLRVAKDSGAKSVETWINEYQAQRAISSFLSSHFRRRLAVRRCRIRRVALGKMQAWSRGSSIRHRYQTLLKCRVEESSRFRFLWAKALEVLPNECEAFSWTAIREQKLDMSIDPETSRKLDLATQVALAEESVAPQENEDNSLFDLDSEELQPLNRLELSSDDDLLVCRIDPSLEVLLSGAAEKWRHSADPKYLSFFSRRVDQLASGDRSRILAKRLQGCKSAIFETYLEQKSGHRILWTIRVTGEILVHYVAKHKEVSRLARHIDSTRDRSDRHYASALGSTKDVVDDSSLDRNGVVELDPLGNTPLKMFAVPRGQALKLADVAWKPPLRLTAEEEQVVKAPGTTLLLGRSGTGKTVCLSQKIDWDKYCAGEDDEFSQLFVARSSRLCRLVSAMVGSTDCCEFMTFDDLLQKLEAAVVGGENNSLFLPSQKMDFAKFKSDVYQSELWEGLDALVIWTNIRSFIKGSLDAVKYPERILPESDYISTETLAEKRCRLSPEHRLIVYKAFRYYHSYMKDLNQWDDCDRISSLLRRLQTTKNENLDLFETVRFSKVYVDEVQDYTQAEILLFFFLGGPGDLFFCGDPAQSVVEGVEFRFEEIRSVGYHVAGPERGHLIPDKPKTVNTSFRSHTGVLTVAAAVLSRLFHVFPDCAKQLSKDRGLFSGPRPSVMYNVPLPRLQEALSSVLKGSYVLSRDEQANQYKQLLGGYPLIYGIREAKGLEFRNVMILNFFSDLPDALQKPWRELLLGREVFDFAFRYPEIEGHLKLLYTAVTRAIDRLFFVESTPSLAGDAFVRWVTTTSTRTAFRPDSPIAVRTNVSDLESMQVSYDEWLLSGLEHAELGEEAEETDVADSMLQKALYSFEQAKHEPYAQKVRTHRLGIKFRRLVQEQLRHDAGSIANSDEWEAQASHLLEQLFREHLWNEASRVLHLVMPLFPPYSQEQLQRQVLNKLPTLSI